MSSDRVGNCSVCGKDASWNSPGVDPDGNLWCSNCKYESKVLIRGVKQRKEDGEYIYSGGVTKRDITIDVENGENMVVWRNKGGIVIPLSVEEKVMDPEILCDRLADEYASGILRCTECKEKISKDDVGGHPLFAGLACKQCWDIHVEGARHDRRCVMCGQPKRFCCC